MGTAAIVHLVPSHCSENDLFGAIADAASMPTALQLDALVHDTELSAVNWAAGLTLGEIVHAVPSQRSISVLARATPCSFYCVAAWPSRNIASYVLVFTASAINLAKNTAVKPKIIFPMSPTKSLE